MTDANEICGVCGEPRHAHVTTAAGPETHPREARGEGRYALVREGYIHGGGAWEDDTYMPPVYRFIPTKRSKK